MQKAIKRLIAILFFWRKAPATIRKSPQRDPDLYQFKATILDRLDWYFMILKRMKRGDRQTYDLYSRIGAAIMPVDLEDKVNDVKELSPWWIKNRPAFGAFMCADPHEHKKTLKEMYLPNFVYFHKYRPSAIPPHIQRAKGDIYVITSYWDDPHDKRIKHGRPAEFAVAIDRDANIKILRVQVNEPQIVPRKRRRRGNKDKTTRIPNRKFRHEGFFIDWADQHNREVVEYLKWMFILIGNFHALHNSEMAKIRVRKKNLTAIFTIDIERTPYFFQERETTVLKGGKKKPIFHIVRTHARIKNGVTRYVRTHFRGEKSFSWNGYTVNITIPGWHHHDISEFNVASVTGNLDDPQDPKYLNTEELGDILNKIEDSGAGRHHR